jgi:hypothetical protein
MKRSDDVQENVGCKKIYLLKTSAIIIMKTTSNNILPQQLVCKLKLLGML